MTNQVYTLLLTPAQEKDLIQNEEMASTLPPYAKWQIHKDGCTITCYTSGKTVFQGKNAAQYAEKYQSTKADILPQAGSDEVGTGDYFGPVCVCAAIVTDETLPLVRKLGVRDSKQLTDAEMRKIAPELLANLPHSLLTLPPAKYNQVHPTNNMNAIKAKMHNKAYANLAKKVPLPSFRVIDQFTPEKTYYRYIADEPEIIRSIHFQTKAENAYPAVGAASIICRYTFLSYMDQMSEKYGVTFPKGAGAQVDVFAQNFVDTYGFTELGKVAKISFANTGKLTY